VKLAVAILAFVAAAAPFQGAEPPSASVNPPSPLSPAEIVDRYVKAIETQQSHPRAVSMDVDMDAKLPKLKKEGRLHAFRFITRVGQIFYQRQKFEGDSTIKKEVIARYLNAERDARENKSTDVAVTPANYKFRYRGMTDYAGRPAFVLQVSPKKKRLGLYKGELWVDQQTYLPLREWGQLVKSPSMFLKEVYFVRDYMIYDGISVPRRLISDISTRLVGRAQLTIWYENVKVAKEPDAACVLGAPAATVMGDTGAR